MSLNLQHLRAFHAVAIEGSVSRAARRLGVAQPTLSQHLRNLELRYSIALFENRKPPLQLTSAGRELLVMTRQLVSLQDQIETVLGGAIDAEVGELRLGSDSPIYAARLVASYHAAHPSKLVHVRIGNANEVNSWLKNAEIDAAICSDPAGDDQIHYQVIYRDELAAALPRNHSLACEERVPVSAFTGETLLLREATSRTRRATERMLEAAGVVVGTCIHFHTRETIREAVALGLGVSFFYSAECPPDERIAYRPISALAPCPSFTGFLMCLAERRRSPLMRALFAAATDLTRHSPLPL